MSFRILIFLIVQHETCTNHKYQPSERNGSHVDIFFLFSSCTDPHVFENEKRLRRKPREIWWLEVNFIWCSFVRTKIAVLNCNKWYCVPLEIHCKYETSGNVFNASCGSSFAWHRGSIDRQVNVFYRYSWLHFVHVVKSDIPCYFYVMTMINKIC